MKMNDKDFEALRDALSGQEMGTTERDRWDALWRFSPTGFMARLYRYLNDNHIDTALRRLQRHLYDPSLEGE